MQTPHSRSTHAGPRGIKFPIRDPDKSHTAGTNDYSVYGTITLQGVVGVELMVIKYESDVLHQAGSGDMKTASIDNNIMQGERLWKMKLTKQI